MADRLLRLSNFNILRNIGAPDNVSLVSAEWDMRSSSLLLRLTGFDPVPGDDHDVEFAEPLMLNSKSTWNQEENVRTYRAEG